ncbi:MAG TPA: N-acetylmuramoyl-L-alanine amidase [Candidatus Binatia bacterium]|nr:N-acetylmuramoyl-L-alanine amidase [Candidatus Binatia bacterium]
MGLLELLEPLGAVSAKAEGSRWRLRYNNMAAEFTAGKTHARVQARDTDLGGMFLIENGRGLVPLASLSSLLPRFLGGPVALHEASARLFIGNVGTHFTASIAPDDASHLIFRFTAPVNPSVASEPGKLTLTFNREPLTAPASTTLTFDSKAIPSANYSEGNGAAAITVNTSVPLMANFSPDGRSVTLVPAKTLVANGAPGAQAGNNTAQPPKTSPPAQQPNPRRVFAVIDASHGGNDRGEALSPTLAEKDVTVALARRLRQELENRGISSLVLRDSDADPSLDERAYYANTMHAAVYISFHASASGHGARVYTGLLPATNEEDRGPFRVWACAQASSLGLSQAAAASVTAELRKQQLTVRHLTAPLRPLNNVVMAAIAVEVAPSASDAAQLTSVDYQQLVARGVADGIAAMRLQLGAAP